LAIGKSGQNVRLAAKLTGWNVDIDGADDAGIEATAEEVEEKPKPKKAGDLEDALIAASTDEVEKEEAAEEAEDKPVVETEAESNDEAK
jgi:N utilization substance protein A